MITARVSAIDSGISKSGYTKGKRYQTYHLTTIEEHPRPMRCYTSEKFYNFKYWKEVKIGDILTNLWVYKNNLINADSNFQIQRRPQ